jgi:hypothetical protein
MPLPAGGAGWVAFVFGADVVLDLAGFVEAVEFEDAGAFELAGAGAAAALELELEGVLDALVSAALVDFDFLSLADLVSELASVDAAASVDEALADLDFFEPADFVSAVESVEVDESALADFDFFELVDLVPDAESADAVVSPDDALADLDFFELAEALELPESSVSEVDFDFFDFDVEDFAEVPEEVSLESVELASVDFFFDLLVFFAGVVLESVACAFTGAALASASPSPAEIRNAQR